MGVRYRMAIGVIGNDSKNKLISDKQNNKYFKDEIYDIIDEKNTNESRSILCSKIVGNSTVLDVGCASGVIGKFLHEHKACKVYGIEMDQESISLAKKTNCYEKLYSFDISNKETENYKNFFKENLKFDYIVFSDVLEHLVFPAEVLYEFRNLLKENGRILISIPNIAHYDIINGLLNENFNYSDMGILDNTHLRFFTKSSFAQYIDSANNKFGSKYDLEWLGKTVIKPYFYGKYEELDRIVEKNEDLFVLQNLFLLKKVENDITLNGLENLLKEKNKDFSQEINENLLSNKQCIIGLEKEVKNLEKKVKDLKQNNVDLTSINENLENIKYKQSQEIEKLTDIQTDLVANIQSLNNEMSNIVNSKSWKYTQFIRSYKLKQKRKRLRTNKIDNKESILFIVLSWINPNDKSLTTIGGTTLHLLDIINGIKNNVNSYVLTVINNHYVLVTFDGNTQKIYDLQLRATVKSFDKYDFNFMKLLFELIENLKIDLVHIHHLKNFPCDLQFLPKRIKTIITLHDYYPICPKVELINYNDNLCKNGEKLDCMKCMKYANLDLETRKEAINNLLENANTVIAPDESVLKEFNYYTNFKNTKVIPHGINLNSFGKINKNKKIDFKEKNIAFVGVITKHKGLEIVKDLIINNKENIVYHFFGLSNDDYLNKNHNQFVYHGVYKQSELPRLLIKNKIDLVILPSILPETFSYTLSETILAGVPVVSYDLGAIANRIKKDNLGWVINKTANFKYTDFVKKYDEIFNVENYKAVLKSLKNYKDIDILDMLKEMQELYQLENYKTKVYDKINEYLEKYDLKYTI